MIAQEKLMNGKVTGANSATTIYTTVSSTKKKNNKFKLSTHHSAAFLNLHLVSSPQKVIAKIILVDALFLHF